MNKIYIGWDSREAISFEVAKFSILSRTQNAEIFPLKLEELPMLQRPIEQRGNQMWCPISEAPVSTEFTFSRFLIPHISSGWTLFCDSDVVAQTDIQELFSLADDRYAVMVVKHKQETGSAIHKVDQVQTFYKRKNWSSVVLWNCNHPAHKRLTLENINKLPGRDLHAFYWLHDEEIGELDKSWNFLVGVYPLPDKVNLAHYTLGGPWLAGWEKQPDDAMWTLEHNNYYQECLHSLEIPHHI